MLASTQLLLADFLETIDNTLGNIWVMLGMGAVLVGLIVVFFMVRNKKEED